MSSGPLETARRNPQYLHVVQSGISLLLANITNSETSFGVVPKVIAGSHFQGHRFRSALVRENGSNASLFVKGMLFGTIFPIRFLSKGFQRGSLKEGRYGSPQLA